MYRDRECIYRDRERGCVCVCREIEEWVCVYVKR